MENSDIFLLLLPLVILQLILTAVALVHIFKNDNYRCGNRVIWVLIVVLVNIIGPILYFALGRGE